MGSLRLCISYMLFILWLFTKGCSQGALQWEGSDLELPICCPFALETAFVHDNSSSKQVPPRGSQAEFMSMECDVVTTHLLSLVMLFPNVALQGVSFTNLGVPPKVSRDQRGGVLGLTCRGGERGQASARLDQMGRMPTLWGTLASTPVTGTRGVEWSSPVRGWDRLPQMHEHFSL